MPPGFERIARAGITRDVLLSRWEEDVKTSSHDPITKHVARQMPDQGIYRPSPFGPSHSPICFAILV
jgi:hypothetical protein